MKNHFFISYSGNKRNEVNSLYTTIKDKKISTIIEPFCGTSAFSYYCSTQEPLKYKYILNDNNIYLIELYNIARDENKLNELINRLNNLIINIDKIKYLEIIKNINNIESWLIKNKICKIRPGIFPNNYKAIDFNYLKDCKIINFLRTENIEIKNIDAIELVKQYENKKDVLLFLDPPYLDSCNDFYLNSNTNVYEYLHNNSIKKMKCTVLLCLENNWIVKFLFNKFIIKEYIKMYETTKKKTTHLIILNR